MNCSRCGTPAQDNQNYCVECGAVIRVAAHTPAPAPEPPIPVAAVDIDADPEAEAISRELFDIWQLYEAGDLEVALEKGAAIVKRSPDSAAAHSVVALVQERLADRKFVASDFDGGVAGLRQAIAHYERILQINPHSEADRAKLIGLRKRLVGPVARTSQASAKETFVEWVGGLSLPVRVGAVVFLCALVIFAVALTPGSRRNDATSQGQRVRVRVETPDMGSGVDAAAGWQGYGPQDVYTYKAPSQVAAPVRSIADMLGSKPEPRASSGGTGPPVTITPFSPQLSIRTSGSSGDSGTKSDRDSGDSNVSRTTTPPTTASGSNDDGTADDLWMKALTFRRQGQPKLAVAAAEKAISLYQQQIDKGKDVETAKLGIENAKTLIKKEGEQ
jgi:hypothetical protein